MPETLREFVKRYTALTMTRKVYSWELLNAINRRILDPRTIRLFFAPRPTKLIIRNIDHRSIDVPLHPSEEMGSRWIEIDEEVFIPGDDASKLEAGSEIRLKYLCNVRIEGRRGDSLVGIGSFDAPRPGVPIIQWVPRDSRNIRVYIPGRLYNEANELIPDSLKLIEGVAEPYIERLSVGAHVQFERFGYCVKDKESLTFIFTHR